MKLKLTALFVAVLAVLGLCVAQVSAGEYAYPYRLYDGYFQVGVSRPEPLTHPDGRHMQAQREQDIRLWYTVVLKPGAQGPCQMHTLPGHRRNCSFFVRIVDSRGTRDRQVEVGEWGEAGEEGWMDYINFFFVIKRRELARGPATIAIVIRAPGPPRRTVFSDLTYVNVR